MRWVFDALFDDAGTSLADHLTLHPIECLARHAWSGTEPSTCLPTSTGRPRRSPLSPAQPRRRVTGRSAPGRNASTERWKGRSSAPPRPTAFSLAAGSGLRRRCGGISPFSTLWKALGEHFRDPRLRQLFGRYATYSGSSPFLAPATLMLIAHVEQQGVWLVEGGMVRLAQALASLAEREGAVVRVDAPVAEITVAGWSRDRSDAGQRRTDRIRCGGLQRRFRRAGDRRARAGREERAAPKPERQAVAVGDDVGTVSRDRRICPNAP